MIYLTGDIHGSAGSYHISPDAFRPAKRGDIVICAGDLGGVWWHDYHTNEKHKHEEDCFLDSKLRKRVLWMAVDGNHENFSRLFWGEFPLVDLFGGKAYKVRENVYYLKRGEIFTIEGETFLAFGGATSHDKNPGWITPTLAWGSFAEREWNKGRTEGIDWWPEEVPSQEDLENAYLNLDRVGWKVDYVITHTCPSSQRNLFGGKKHSVDPVETMLQELWDKGLSFKSWHFGHYHYEHRVGKFVCHFNDVHPLIKFEEAGDY